MFKGIFSHVAAQIKDNHIHSQYSDTITLYIIFVLKFVCVEVLRPSQPNGVMSSMVSLPNHTFTGQA